MVRVCGASMALLAFAVAVFRGLAVDNPTETILARALWSLLTFLIIGSAIGWVGQSVIKEHSRQVEEQEAQVRSEAEAKVADEAATASAEDGDEAEKEDSARVPEGAGVRAG
jgi:hypothetical protein